MKTFDETPENLKASRGVRNHRNKDNDRNYDDYKSLKKANRRERPRERYFEEDENEE